MGKVFFFETGRGNWPVKTWMETLDKHDYAKTLRFIKLLRDFGYAFGLPYSRKITENLYELRIVGKKTWRVIYSRHKDDYYLLHVFAKKTAKTPRKEVKTAIDRRKRLL